MNEQQNKEWYQLGLFTGESTCAILATVMSEHYINCEFEAVEYGDGTYKLMVSSMYYDFVEWTTRQQMFTFAITAHVIIATTQRELKNAGVLQ